MGEYFSGMSTPKKIGWLLSGGKDANKSEFLNSRTAAFRKWGMFGGGGLMLAPAISGMVFGNDSPITGMASAARGIGVSGGIGVGLATMRKGGSIASGAWLGVSAFNMLRGAGYSPLSTFKGW
jgi:hypothetical protein